PSPPRIKKKFYGREIQSTEKHYANSRSAQSILQECAPILLRQDRGIQKYRGDVFELYPWLADSCIWRGRVRQKQIFLAAVAIQNRNCKGSIHPVLLLNDEKTLPL
ncbi:hypothetical protein, partial [Erythrobacter sp. YJ-T3-07]|uniref:hypothetical protein n=1 Tax=Erythrobacter sp. YJ-T3-07 TaxID=2793063 RepID=UPI001F324B3D